VLRVFPGILLRYGWSRMKIELNLFATLKRYIPDEVKGNSWKISISEGTKVRELLEQVKIPTDAVKLVFLNGIHANGNETLKDGDRVGVFPPIGGG
jgi:sulfur carrier protein ThiS